MIGGRLLPIGAGAAGLLGTATVERVRGTTADGSQLPRRLRITLERLGPTFVKFGQTLSLRRDLLPDLWLAELRPLDRACSGITAVRVARLRARAVAVIPAGVRAVAR